VNSQNLGAGVIAFKLLRDVLCNAFHGPNRIVRGCRYGCGDDRGCSELSDTLGNRFQCFRGTFHDVASASAVDVDIYEARDSSGVFSTDFCGSRGKLKLVALADAFNFAVANQNSGIVKFGSGSNRLADM